MRTNSSDFIVTTANTQYTRALSSPENTQDFAGTDILLMQEVLKTTPEKVNATLGMIGLKLAAMDTEAGLAIAVSDRFNVNGTNSYEVQPRSRLANKAESLGLNPRLRKRSLLVAHLTDNEGHSIDVATGHPIVFARYRQRRRQVKATSNVLVQNLPDGNLIYGSDGNHYPAPRKIDRKLALDSRLQDVSNNEPTVMLDETKHRYLKRFGFKNARLDSLLHRGIEEVSSSILKVMSDHRAIQAVFRFVDRIN